MDIDLVIPEKLVWIFNPPKGKEFILLHGGRSGGKTETVARRLITIAMLETTRILCTREIQGSIKDSVKKVLEDVIDEMGLTSEFSITQNSIVCNRTGTDFVFIGMKVGTDAKSQSIKSTKGIKYIWVEEAQSCSMASLKLLTPTFRIDGRMFFFTFNRHKINDPVMVRFKHDPKAVIQHINYTDNELCPQVSIDEALQCKEEDEDDYNHVWLGEPLSDSSMGVIKRKWVMAAIDIYKRHRNNTGQWFASLDPSDGGKDNSGFSMRKGMAVEYVTDWPRIEADAAVEYGMCEVVKRVPDKKLLGGFLYEVNGIGAAARVKLKDYKDVAPIGFNASGQVLDPDKDFVKGRKNVDHFENLKAQQWWKMRELFKGAYRVSQGKTVNPDNYLTINPKIAHLDKLIDELCQVEWKLSKAGKVMIVKAPKDCVSPNEADSVMILYYNPKRKTLWDAA